MTGWIGPRQCSGELLERVALPAKDDVAIARGDDLDSIAWCQAGFTEGIDGDRHLVLAGDPGRPPAGRSLYFIGRW